MASGTGERVDVPVKRCRRCNNMPSNGVKCVKCGSLLHPGCLKYLNNIVKIDDKYVNCCGEHVADKNGLKCDQNMDSDLVAKLINSDETDVPRENKIEVLYLKKLLNEKENLINNLNDNIHFLKEQINVLNNLLLRSDNELASHCKFNESRAPPVNEKPQTSIEAIQNHGKLLQQNKCENKPVYRNEAASTSSSSTVSDIVNTHGRQNLLTSNKKHVITNEEVKLAVLDAQSTLIKQTNQQKTRLQHFSPMKIVGSNQEASDLVASNKNWYFISKYTLSYSSDDLLKYLENKFPGRKFLVEQVKNWGTYNSFKFAADEELEKSILDPNLWPQGVEVAKYKFKKQPFRQQRNHQGFSGQEFRNKRRHYKK